MKTMKSICLFSAFSLTLIAGNVSSVLANDTSAGPLADITKQASDMMEKININTASLDSLTSIPGMPAEVGKAIEAYRNAHGSFKSLAELANVDGLDASLLEKIKPFLTI